MGNVQISMGEMLQRVARFSDLKPFKQAFVDSLIPGHERENFRVIGPGVSENPDMKPPITDAHGFSLGGIRAKPGKGAALHSHTTTEVFVPFSGEWAIYWGDQGENEVVLGPLDTISVPPGVMRGFRNVGKEEAYLMVVMDGADPGRVTWSQDVLDKAVEGGIALNEKGDLPVSR